MRTIDRQVHLRARRRRQRMRAIIFALSAAPPPVQRVNPRQRQVRANPAMQGKLIVEG